MDLITDYNPIVLFANDNRTFLEDVILSFYIFIFVYISYRIILAITDRIFPTESTIDVYKRRKIGSTIYLVVSLFFVIPIFFARIEYLPTLLGFTGAGLIISLKEFLQNFAGWFLIMGSNGFSVGDRIEISGVKGDVINIGLMRFTLLELDKEHVDQSTNRIIHVPNNMVVLDKVYVVSSKMDFIWDEMKLLLTIDSNWKKAEKISYAILNNESVLDPRQLEEKIRELSKNYLVRIGKTTPIIYSVLEDGKIAMSLRYLTRIRDKRNHRASISREILESFQNENDIRFYSE